MPIQFRCPACDRLLGIARRKAGKDVACPRCGAGVRVPALAGMAIESADPSAAARMPIIPPLPGADAPRRKKSKATNGHPLPSEPRLELEAMPLFERPDFEALLNPAVQRAKPDERPAPPAPPPVAAAPIVVPLPPVQPVSSPDVDVMPAVVVTRKNLILVAVVIAVLIGLAFAAGYALAALTLKGNKPTAMMSV